jgi:hypothetical protein
MAFTKGNFYCLGHMISIVSVPQSGWSGVRILVGRKLSLLQNDQTHPRSHPALPLWGNGVPFWVYSGQGILITTDVRLMVRLQWSYTFTPHIRLHYAVLPTGWSGDLILLWALDSLH